MRGCSASHSTNEEGGWIIIIIMWECCSSYIPRGSTSRVNRSSDSFLPGPMYANHVSAYYAELISI